LPKKEEQTLVVTRWHGRGFGEPAYISLFTHILNDNGIPSMFDEHRNVRGLLDVPIFRHGEEYRDWFKWGWRYELNDVPIMRQMVDRASEYFNKEVIIQKQRDHIPVIFEEMDVPEVDVTLNTKTGPWCPYKLWPYFDELKVKMEELGITYYDLDGNETYSIECLNIVKKSKLYVGLDTGMAHYVSKFANGKTLIMNGGFVSFHFWAFLYDYEPIQVEDVSCRPCYINRNHVKEDKVCKYDNRCMKEITVDMVLSRICERLGK